MRAYRIGEFAEIGGVTAKTLRYYDEVGLLRPAVRDSRSGYRLYTPEQLKELSFILNLRAFGLSIEEICRLKSRKSWDCTTPQLLDQLRLRVEADLARSRAALALLDATERFSTGSLLSITTRYQRPRAVASLRAKLGSYTDVIELETELARAIPRNAIGSDKGVLWHSCADSGSLEAEAFVALNTAQRLPGKLDFRELPALKSATVYCLNEHEPAEIGYDSLRAWMSINGHALAGPKCEIEHGSILEIAFPFAVLDSAA